MTVVVDGAGLPIKKQFLQRSFFPVGSDVCEGLGILRSSDDVRDMEIAQARAELVHGSTEFYNFLVNRVRWYVEGTDALEHMDEAVANQRDLSDHLSSFGLALLVDVFAPLWASQSGGTRYG